MLDFKIDFKAFTIGCVAGIVVSSLVTGIFMFLTNGEVFIIKNSAIHPCFAGVFIAVVNIYAVLDTPIKDYRPFGEAGFTEIKREHKDLLAFYPYFSALIALICVLSMVISLEFIRGGFSAVILAAFAVIMGVGFAAAISFLIITGEEKNKIYRLKYDLEESRRKD